MKKTYLLLLINLFILLSPQRVVADEEPFERFIGLGNSCRSRIQINMHFNKRLINIKSYTGGGQLFDWLIIHDYNLLSQAIENNLSDLLERDDMRLDHNLKYKMSWWHLFSRNENHLVTQEIIDNEFHLKKEKIDYLANKFKQLGNYKTLYIITYPWDKDGSLNCSEPDKPTLERLKNALINIRQNDNFSILFCTTAPKFDDFDNIYVRQVPSDKYTTDCLNEILFEFPFKINQAINEKSDDPVSGFY